MSDFLEKRRKAINGGSSSSSFLESRKMELGIIPDTRIRSGPPVPTDEMVQSVQRQNRQMLPMDEVTGTSPTLSIDANSDYGRSMAQDYAQYASDMAPSRQFEIDNPFNAYDVNKQRRESLQPSNPVLGFLKRNIADPVANTIDDLRYNGEVSGVGKLLPPAAQLGLETIGKKLGVLQDTTSKYMMPDASYIDQPGTNVRNDFINQNALTANTGSVMDFTGQTAAQLMQMGMNSGTGASLGAMDDVAEGLSRKVSSKIANPLASKIAGGFTRGAIDNGVSTFQQDLGAGSSNLKQATIAGLEGAALGGVLGGAGGGLVHGYGALNKRVKGIETPNMGFDTSGKTPRSRTAEEEEMDIIHDWNDKYGSQYDEVSQGIRNLDDEISSLDSEYEKAVNDQYNFLKESRDSRGGVEQGKILTDEEGNVIDRVGRISNNPSWYQDFYSQYGRVPTNKDLKELAKLHVDQGFMDDAGYIPGWASESGYHSTKKQLLEARGEMAKDYQDLSKRMPKSAREGSADLLQQTEVKTSPEVKKPVQGTQEAPEPNVRSNYTNQQENGNFSDDFYNEQSKRDLTYEPQSNKETMDRVNKRFREESVESIEADFNQNQVLSAEHTATGYRLMQELDRAGQNATDPKTKEMYIKRAVNVADKLAADLTRSGQASQAAAVLKRLSPEGQLMQLTKKAAENGKTVSPKDAEKFMKLARERQAGISSGPKAAKFHDILDRMKKGETVSTDELERSVSDLLESSKKETSKTPKETKPRVRDKVLSHLEKEANKARKELNSKRNFGIIPNQFHHGPKLDKVTKTIKLYHGSDADFQEFRPSKAQAGEGVFLTDNPDAAKEYGKNIYHVEIAPSKLANDEDWLEAFDELESEYKKRMSFLEEKLDNKEISEAEFDKVSREWVRGETGNLEQNAKVSKRLKEKGFDVYQGDMQSGDSGKEYLVLDPTAIKKVQKGSGDTVKEKVLSYLEQEAEKAKQELASKRNLGFAQKLGTPDVVLWSKVMAYELAKKAVNLADFTEMLVKQAGESFRPHAQEIFDRANKLIKNADKRMPDKKKILEKFLKEGKYTPEDEKTLRDLVSQIDKLDRKKGLEADMQMQRILNKYEKSSPFNMLQTIRYMAMLLNESTQTLNAISGPIMMTYRNMVDIFLTPIDIAMNKITKGKWERTTTFKQGPSVFNDFFTPLVEWFEGLATGAKAGWFGVDPEGITSQHDRRGLAFKGKYNPLGWAERTLGAVSKGADYATFNSMRNMELRKLAYLDAINNKVGQGLKGKAKDDAIKAHMKKFIADPPQAALERAARQGKKTTFQYAEGLAGALTKSKVTNRLLNPVVPFIKTPTNIGITGVENTPAGLVKGLYEIYLYHKQPEKISKREIMQTLAFSTVGGTGTIGGLSYVLAKMGIMTGDYESDDKDAQQVLDRIGKGKFKFNSTAFGRMFEAMMSGKGLEEMKRVSQYQKGDTQHDYNRLQPLAFPAAAGATLGQTGDITKAGKSSLGSLFSMSALQGVQQTLDVPDNLTTGDKAVAGIFNAGKSYLKSFSPSILAREAQRQDPVQRKTTFGEGFKDVSTYYQSRTPKSLKSVSPWGTSDELPARMGNLGDTGQNTFPYLNPLRSEEPIYNEAAKIIYDVMQKTGDDSIAPSPASKSFTAKKKGEKESTKVALDPKRYEKLQEDTGKAISKKITALPINKRSPDNIQKIYDDVRKAEMDKVKKEMGYLTR